MLSSPSPGQQVQTPQSMPPPPQPSPQPGQPSSQPNSNVSSGPAPSPSSFLPSPSPQPSQSPVTARTPQNFSVPSPGPLNTPVNPSSVMSPAGSSQAEEQQYLDKLKQLSKYIEPLRRMINKIDKNEDRKKDLSKMKSLLDILTDPSKRCPLKTLQKCEIALEKLKNDMAVPTPPPPPVPPTKQQYLCQPLLDAVLANIRSPVFNHSLYRTFMPAMTAIHGPPPTLPVVCARKRKFEEDERQSIPNVLQGEVARLDPKFLVNLDPSHCSNNGTVHLICNLREYPGRAGPPGREPCSSAPGFRRVPGPWCPEHMDFQALPQNWPHQDCAPCSVQLPTDTQDHTPAPGPQPFCPSQESACIVLDPDTPGPRTPTEGRTTRPRTLTSPCCQGSPLLSRCGNLRVSGCWALQPHQSRAGRQAVRGHRHSLLCCRRQGPPKCAAAGAQCARRLPRPESAVDRPAVAVRRQPLPAVGAPIHDLEAAAAPRQALGHSPAQHLGAEHPPGLPLGCLAVTTAASRAASPPGPWGQLAALLGPQRTHVSCQTLLAVGSLREPGLRLAFLLLSPALGTYQPFSHTCTGLGQVAAELAASVVAVRVSLGRQTPPGPVLLGLLSLWLLQGPCPSPHHGGEGRALLEPRVCAQETLCPSL
ncbi:mediator complex subunit 15 [Phyllostomus discolor]|uniref:Mediator complex subunit 15 n=1 Tax=Phyllostomus discolor TaxID=89673 RepID=A0A833YT40_9CHIR|nr:mediator complex subunit 15 [Phyllostomus discolor]